MNYSTNQALILCGGLGTRLGFLTSDTPKPLLKVLGRPFLEYLIDNLIYSGLVDIVLSVGYLKERFYYLVSRYPNIRLSDSQSTIQESVESVHSLRERFLVVNGDCSTTTRYKKTTFLGYRK